MATHGDLDQVTLERLFRTHVIADLTRHRSTAVARPHLIVVGGQPGSGKSSSAHSYAKEFSDQGGIVPVIGDDYRRFHPRFLDVITTDDTNLAATTGPAALWWVQAAATWCRGRRVNVLIEATLRDREQSFNPTVAAQFAAAGYQITIIVLAVPALVSKLGVVHRYVRQRQVAGGALWTTLEAHDRAFQSLPATLNTFEHLTSIDRIVVRTRSGELAVHSNRAAPVRRTDPARNGGIVEALRRVHSTPAAPEQHLALRAHWGQLNRQLSDTSRAEHPAIAPMVEAINRELQHGSRRDRPALRSHRPPETDLQTT